MAGTTSVDGLISGLNTKDIVDKLMAVERRGAVLLENEQTLKTNIVSALKALQAKFLALNAQLGQLRRRDSFEKYAVNVSDDAYLTAQSTGRVAVGTYDVQVLSLARNHQIASQGVAEADAAVFGTGTIILRVGDGSEKTITINESNRTLEGIRDAINDAKAGATASIINDGSSSKPYRLIISGDKTGLKNKIEVTVGLTGGETLNFNTSSFDNPETLEKSLASTSRISLGPTASYSGAKNKIYSFTVQGTGAQTVGTGSILVNWSDGTNSGAIAITQADQEVVLAGDGADGMTLSFTAGALTAGDTFQVAAFSPLLQQASDAKIAFGSNGGSGSPITVTSDTNTFDNVIKGLSLTARKQTATGESVAVTTALDVTAVKAEITAFIDRYNEVQKFIDDQNTYDKESQESGLLFGDGAVMAMQSSLRMAVASRVPGISSVYNQLSAIGLRSDAKGQLTVKDSAALDKALSEHLEDVVRLFTTAGDSANTAIKFVSASEKVKSGATYSVDVTQAATHGGYTGAAITEPSTTPLTLTSSNNRLKLAVDGMVSGELVLTAGTYNSHEDLVTELQSKIDADSLIGGRGVKVEWISDGNGRGHLKLLSSSYGEASYVRMKTEISNGAFLELGLSTGTDYSGQDVAGTINGEAADGLGQTLTGKSGNATTDGLKLRITLDESQVISGVEGLVTISKGAASRMGDSINSLTRTGNGAFDRKVGALQKQIDLIKTRVKEIDARLAMRRATLEQEFYDMETALGALNAQSTFLTNQITSMNANWNSNA